MSVRLDRPALLLAAGLAGWSCAPFHLDIRSCPIRSLPDASDKITVRYLGVGGFLIYRGDPRLGRVVLTAPLYSNPSLVELLGDHAVRPDTELIDRLLPPEAGYARAIVAGHSHYDHLMDVPYIALHKATAANVYANTTAAHLLAPIAGAMRAKGTAVIPFIDSEIWDPTHTGVWKTIAPDVRVAAIRSEHSPQISLKTPLSRQATPFLLWRGGTDEDRTELPRSASEWAEGAVLAYVIDFMDGDHIAFRIYYQDSGTNEPIGFVPPGLKGRDCDLTIVCLGGDSKRLLNNPKGIIANTNPRYVILAHWEDFFVTQDAYCRDGGHYGLEKEGGKPPYCSEGRIYALPSRWPLEETNVKAFRKDAAEAMTPGRVALKPLIPCPTRSVFEFDVP